MSAHGSFVPASPGDSRSPCPALNALANHSHIPHDGRSIPFFQLVDALRSIYRFSWPLALLLSVVGFLTCGHWTGSGFSRRLKLDLHDLARHGRIEHDGSLGHADALPGEVYAPSVPDAQLIAQLLNSSYESSLPSRPASAALPKNEKGLPVVRGTLNFSDLVHARFLRDAQMSRPLDPVHKEIAHGEVGLVLQAFSDAHGSLPREWLAQWFGEERLPEGWIAPREEIGLLKSVKLSRKIQTELNRLKQYSS